MAFGPERANDGEVAPLICQEPHDQGLEFPVEAPARTVSMCAIVSAA